MSFDTRSVVAHGKFVLASSAVCAAFYVEQADSPMVAALHQQIYGRWPYIFAEGLAESQHIPSHFLQHWDIHFVHKSRVSV